jgi:hypothetical protein
MRNILRILITLSILNISVFASDAENVKELVNKAYQFCEVEGIDEFSSDMSMWMGFVLASRILINEN